MDGRSSKYVENLRTRSKTLLVQVDENIKKINKEVEKLSLHNRSLCKSPSNKRDSNEQNNFKSWKLRNDSSAITKLLCPDIPCVTPKYTPPSMYNTLSSGRIVLTSEKSKKSQCPEDVRRKHVKGCYCNVIFNKPSKKTTKSEQIHDRFSNQHKYPEHDTVTYRKHQQEVLSPSISCETLRRAEKIDYVPTSQFLRNVQSQISQIQDLSLHNTLKACSRSSCYHKVISKSKKDEEHSVCCRCFGKNFKSKNDTRKLKSKSKGPAPLEASEEDENVEYYHPTKSSRQIFVHARRPSKSRFIIKKTLTSKKIVPELKQDKNSLRSPINKRTTREINADCPCCVKNCEKTPKAAKTHSTEVLYCSPTICRSHDNESKDYLSDTEVRNIKQFREENYFDTHGSSHTLVSSCSSGSLEQCVLNDRLFPVSIGRIHKKDLVVSMPPCATVQRKRVHYFPRYVVKQKKSDSSTNYKKKRCQSCPLTGHAIDLGVLKTRPPINSLALKYQKQMP